jgi:cyanate permease
MLMMAEIFSGLALMPRSEMIKLSSIPLGIPKTHFLGLSLMFLARRHLKA